jgi:prepilin-type N-terminal cleavage/methylation domain-containing protein
MKVNSTPKSGFTLVEIMIVVAIIGLLAAIAIPNFIKARQISQKNACIANLKQIDGAINTWALEKGKTSAAVAGDADIFGPTLYVKVKPICPANGTYTYRAVGATDSSIFCSLSVSPEFHTLVGQQ